MIIDWSDGMDTSGSGNYPLASEPSGRTFFTDTEAAHSHSASSGAAGAHTHGVTVDASSASATSSSGQNVPAYLGFVKIIRIF